MTAAMIDNFRIDPAGHCGSGAMRNLLRHYCQLDLPEGVVFGLGAGLDSVYMHFQGAEPPYMLFGRGSTMEADLARTLGVDYTEQIQTDNDLAWEEVKAEIEAGRPTMLSGDIYYLDYREFKVHFPAHRFILLGYDEARQEVYIADRVNDYPETCSIDAVRLSRNPDNPMSTQNLWGKFHSGEVHHSLPDACGIALGITTARMLGSDESQLELMRAFSGGSKVCATGLDGLALFREEVRAWPGLADPEPHITYFDNAIVKFGTGGGFFRNHFADFLHWSVAQRPDLVDESLAVLGDDIAAQWNALSPLLQKLAGQTGDTALWQQMFAQLGQVYENEKRLFEGLAAKAH